MIFTCYPAFGPHWPRERKICKRQVRVSEQVSTKDQESPPISLSNSDPFPHRRSSDSIATLVFNCHLA